MNDVCDTQLELETRRVFQRMATAWANHDLEGTLALMSEKVVHTINVARDVMPFAASVNCKADMRRKLEQMLMAFEVGAYVTDHLSVEGHVARAYVKIIYVHIDSGERLITRVRYVVEQRDGQVVRIDQYQDAAYVEAFMRLIAAYEKGLL